MLQIGLSPLEIIKEYSGNATFMLMFALSLVYLWVFEKNKVKKAVLVFMSLTLVLLFVFPLFANVFMIKLDEEGTYYRFLWLVPTSIVSGYTVFVILDRFKKKLLQIGAFAVVVVCILIGGVFMYDSPSFFKAQNAYEIPQCVIDMCDDMIVTEGREYEAVFPDEILIYPRMYNAYIVMPYGFEMLQFGTGHKEDIHEEMVKDKINVAILCERCEFRGVHYIIINKNKELDGRFEDFNYEHVGSYGDYDMYKSTVLYFGRWEDFNG
ncbi:MAG: hypothetical protein J5840_09160 [Lachnospiraceae bacterium]|nr:hypothetical protein [Lachnospiraceae bacterium]